MDSITHIALGGVIGEALLGKKLGKKALIFGGLAQSIPDIDFVASFWLPMTDNLLAHRGFTHSILFGVIISALLAVATKRLQKQYAISLWQWFTFFGLQVATHLFLDALNAYGVGWFEPFSHYRISFDTIYVADPFFSLWPGLAFLALCVLTTASKMRRYWVIASLVLSFSYIGYGFYNKHSISKGLGEHLEQQHVVHSRYFTTPAPLNSWLWYILVQDSSGYYVGYRSVFDKKETPYEFRYVYQQRSMLKPYEGERDVENLKRFSQGYYTIEKWSGDTLVFNDLRFGQVIGWHNPNEKFAFHYFLQYPESNALVVQRGRFAKWDQETTRSLIQRIQGK